MVVTGFFCAVEGALSRFMPGTTFFAIKNMLTRIVHNCIRLTNVKM